MWCINHAVLWSHFNNLLQNYLIAEEIQFCLYKSSSSRITDQGRVLSFLTLRIAHCCHEGKHYCNRQRIHLDLSFSLPLVEVKSTDCGYVSHELFMVIVR